MKINTLHFLVHPGFSLAIEEKVRRSRIPRELTQRERENEMELLANYREKIDGLNESDVLVIFSPSEKRTYLRDFREGKEWTTTERYARDKLGDRCIVLTNPDFLRSSKKSDSLNRLWNILERRGFDFPEDTPCEVWGTSLPTCVIDTADEIFRQFKLKEYPVIPVKATNYGNLTQQEIEELEKRLRMHHPNVKLVNRL